jgi:membrane protease YdiL (CAAX protease family)
MKSQVPHWRWWIHFLLIGGYFFPGLMQGLYFAPRHSGHPLLTHSTHGLLIVCGFNFVIFAIVFLLGWLASRATTDELLLRWRPGWWVVPLGVGYSIAIRVGLAVIGFITVLFLLITQLASLESLQDFAMRNPQRIDRLVDLSALQTNRTYYWLSLTVVSFVIAGLREELWRAATLAGRRALWPRAFMSRRGESIAIVLIAVAFGAAHSPMGALAAIAAGLLGLLLGIILIVHQSIWPAVIAHGLFDATTFALLPLVASKFPQPGA